MSRMVRKVVIGVAVLLMACLLAVVFFFDAIAARVVSTAGTRVLGVSTTLRSAHLGLLDGKSSLSGLKVAQPTGFGDGSMIEVNSASVTAGLTELLSSDIVIDLVEIDGVTVDLVEIDGKVNLQVVANTVAGDDQAAPAKPDPSAKPASGSVTIRQLKVTNIKVIATTDRSMIGGKPIEITLPDIIVADLGTKTTASEVAAQITTQLMDRLLLAIVEAKIQGLPSSMLSGLQSASSTLAGSATSFLKTTGTAIEQGLEKTGDAIKSLFNK